MKFRRICFLLIIVILPSILFCQSIPLWKADLGEPIREYNFINEGKYLFFTSGEYLWCYNAATGREIWQKEVPDFEKEGISYLLGEMYLTNSDNKLQAYDAVSGKLLWEQEYDDISQEDYRSMEFIKNNAVFRYDDQEVGIDLMTGKELFRMEIDYWGELVTLGSYNYSVLDAQNKMFVLEDSEIASLFDVTNGKKLFSAEDYDINTDLIKNGLPWLYQTPGQDYILTVLEEGAAVIDVKVNRELVRREFSIDGDYNVLLPTTGGCAIMGEEKFVHFNFGDGAVKEFEFPIDDIRTMHAYNAGGTDILIVSMEDRLASIDLAGGKVLWQTAEEDPDYEGYAHRYLKEDGNNIVLTYTRGTLFSEENGTYLFLMSIDGITGKRNYKVPVLLSQAVMTDFTRVLSKSIIGAFSVLTTTAGGQAGAAAGNAMIDMVNDLMGYGNIGFNYQSMDYGENSLLLYSGGGHVNNTNPVMWNPATRQEPGEGYVLVNYKTGDIKYASYFTISAGMSGPDTESLPAPGYYNNKVYIAGNEKLTGFDLDSGKILWETKIEEKHLAEVAEMDGIVYVRYGIHVVNPKLKENDIELKTPVYEDPFGFMAIDAASGKILWDKQFEENPVLMLPQFTIANYYDSNKNLLYLAGAENAYALKMGKGGGSLAWQLSFDESEIGEFELDESYAIMEKWIGSVPRSRSTSTYIGGGWSMTTTTTTGGYDEESVSSFIDEAAGADMTTTYTSWGSIWGVSARKCLRVLYGENVILAIGPERLALLSSADGSIKWSREWDYDNGAMQYLPKVMGDKIVFCMDEKLTVINLADGKDAYEAEVEGKSKFFESPGGANLFNLYDEEISAFPLK